MTYDDKLRQWAREASAIGDCNELSGDAIAEFARRVRADALEEAAKVCDDMVRRTYSNTAVLIAAAENIRHMKEPK